MNEENGFESECDGYKYEIRKNFYDCWCGYVYIPISIYNGLNTFFKLTKDKELCQKIQCHGGITFESSNEDYFIIGFDCAHSFDYIPHLSIGNPQNYKTKEFVINECKEIIHQIKNINIPS